MFRVLISMVYSNYTQKVTPLSLFLMNTRSLIFKIGHLDECKWNQIKRIREKLVKLRNGAKSPLKYKNPNYPKNETTSIP